MRSRLVSQLEAVCIAVFLSAGISVEAQTVSASASPIFTSRSELVLVPVVIHDKEGKHIGSMAQDAFELLDNGKLRKLSVFEEVRTTTDFPIPKRMPTQFGNYLIDSKQSRRLTVIVVDTVSVGPGERLELPRVRASVIAFLSEQLNANEPTSLLVLTGRGLRQIHGFTTDTRVLIDAMRKLRSETARGVPTRNSSVVSDGLRIETASTTASSFDTAFVEQQQTVMTGILSNACEAIARAFAGIPGRKTLVWITPGTPFPIGDTASAMNDRERLRRGWESLNSGNIAVYPVDVMGLTVPGMVAQGSLSGKIGMTRTEMFNPMATPLDERKYIRDSFYLVAEATGGTPCVNNNDIANCMERAQRDSENYYLLGFYLPATERNTGRHKLEVKVNVPHGELRYRQFYDATDAPVEPDPKKAILSAYSSPLDFTELALDVVINGIEHSGDRRKLNFEISLPPRSLSVDEGRDNLIDMDFAAAAFAEKSTSVANISQTVRGNLKPATLERLLKEGLAHKLQLELPPGRYQLKCVVRDNLTGKMGSVSAPVEVP